jgi:hypothetical protein
MAMKRKYAPPIQHTIYRDGWKDALHAVGDALEKRVRSYTDNETYAELTYKEDLVAELAKLVPDR